MMISRMSVSRLCAHLRNRNSAVKSAPEKINDSRSSQISYGIREPFEDGGDGIDLTAQVGGDAIDLVLRVGELLLASGETADGETPLIDRSSSAEQYFTAASILLLEERGAGADEHRVDHLHLPRIDRLRS